MNFKIIIPMYNVEKWIQTTITSVKSQSCKNFQCIIIDDLSSDKSSDIVKDLICNDPRFVLIKNSEKKFALKNIVEAIHFSKPDDEDVIITLDGDDWLSNSEVLSFLINFYNNKKCWMTYGNHYNYPDGKPPWPLFRYPKRIINTNSFRKFRFLGSHLRTFKFWLWKQIKNDDLIDANGVYYQTTWDMVFMFPMLEMCGEKFEFIEDILYIYNNENPNNDYKIYTKLQKETEWEIRAKKPYLKIIKDEK